MTSGFMAGMDIEWQPLLGAAWFWLLAVLGLAVLVVAVWRRAGGLVLRALLYAVLAFLLLQPSLRQDERKALPDKVLVVVDDSQSQKIAKRDAAAEKALAHIQAAIGKYAPDVETVVLRVDQYSDVRKGEATHVFARLREHMLSLPLQQIAATILITDGQVHDAPLVDEIGVLTRLAPVHVVLTGRRDEYDRKVSVVSSPQYGLVGQDITVDVRVDEHGAAGTGAGEMLTVAVWQDGEQRQSRSVAAGEVARFTLPLAHPGQNVFEFKTAVGDGELTETNNTAPVIVNAVRDRLRVLLVSGVPHMGERAWRNLLKSDPGIDLIHFTILRPPTAVDMTPSHELSLIVFPVDELFNSKIDDFDLIIFDKYQQYNLLPPQYFENIRRFIRGGGAFLLAMGSEEADTSIFDSALADTLPVTLAGEKILNGAYRPALTDVGRRQPVTADLPRPEHWGEWLTQVQITATRGKTLMTGRDDKPLMVIDEVEKGRVAVIASDNLWMWSKGIPASGPYGDMLRNLSHWLMKEPELEEDYLRASVKGRVITVAQRQRDGDMPPIAVTYPSGAQQDISLTLPRDGWIEGTLEASENGVYALSNGTRKTFVVVGTAQSEEYADVLTTEARLDPIVNATKGGFVWYQHEPDFALRRVAKSARTLAGDDWLGLRRSEAYDVISVSAQRVFDNYLFLLFALIAIVGVWLLESGRLRRR